MGLSPPSSSRHCGVGLVCSELGAARHRPLGVISPVSLASRSTASFCSLPEEMNQIRQAENRASRRIHRFTVSLLALPRPI